MDFIQFIILLAIVVGIVALYVGTMYLNKAVKVPEECKEAYLDAQTCVSCSSKSVCSVLDDEKFQDAIEFMKEVKL